jgi:hypothetical protein
VKKNVAYDLMCSAETLHMRKWQHFLKVIFIAHLKVINMCIFNTTAQL